MGKPGCCAPMCMGIAEGIKFLIGEAEMGGGRDRGCCGALIGMDVYLQGIGIVRRLYDLVGFGSKSHSNLVILAVFHHG